MGLLLAYWQLQHLFVRQHVLTLSEKEVDAHFNEEAYFRNAAGLLIHFLPLVKNVTCAHGGDQCEPKAVVLFVHGYCEHSVFYTQAAETLNERGYATYALDHAGHGLSQGERGYVEDIFALASDVLFLAGRLKKKHPHVPLLLYGHSLGGAICIMAAHRDAGRTIRATYLEAPLVKIHPSSAAPWQRIAAKLLSFVPKLKVPGSRLKRDLLTKSDKLRQMWERDGKLVVTDVHVGTANAMIRYEEELDRLLAAKQITFPFFVATGDDDIACDWKGAEELYNRATSKEKKIKIYPGLRHTLKYDSEEVISDMADWFDSIVAAK